jgi:hypothetical protein
MQENLKEIRREMEGRTTSELVSILSNRDDEEWRPEVFQIVETILTNRGISTDEIAALKPEGVEVVEARQLVTIGWYPTTWEAHSRRLALEAAGLAAWVCDEFGGTMYGSGVGARLQVRVEDEEAARATLDNEPDLAEQEPEESVDPPCPKCGSTDVSDTSEPPERTPLPQAGGSRCSWCHECRACGHSWLD